MPDVTAQQVNTFLGTAVFDDNAGAGPLTVDLSALTGDTLTLESNLAESVFKVLQAVSETAADLEQATDTYPAITRSIQTTNGVSSVRLSATVNAASPISYSDIHSIS